MNDLNIFNMSAFTELGENLRIIAQEKIIVEFGLTGNCNYVQVHGTELAIRRVADAYGTKAFGLNNRWATHISVDPVGFYKVFE